MWDIPVPSVTTLSYEPPKRNPQRAYLRMIDLRAQRDVIIREALVPFPNLVHFRVGEIVEWSRVERTSSSAEPHWKPRLINMSLVRNILLRQDVRNVHDVDGCLRSTLWQKDLTADVCTRLGFSFTKNT